jgi:CDP-diacylglycerol--serine O-phosphatidyltransferase
MNSNKLQLMYIFPNLFTAASIFTGFLSILASINYELHKAAYLILFSLVLDGLDGRVARLTNTTSKFGVEFDSLADVIAFGVAPAVLYYITIGSSYGRVGILIAGLYLVFGAVRLARFNVSTSQSEPSVFIGLPIPISAVAISMCILFVLDYQISYFIEIFLNFFMLVISFLMVSNIRYPSFKKIDYKKVHAKKALVLFIIIISLVYLYPIAGLCLISCSYVFFGLFRAIYNYFVGKKNKISI